MSLVERDAGQLITAEAREGQMNVSKEEAITNAPTSFQKQHLIWHLLDSDRVLYVGEKRQKTFFFSMLIYTSFLISILIFGAISWTIVVSHSSHPSSSSPPPPPPSTATRQLREHDIFDDYTLVWSFLAAAVTVMVGIGLVSIVHAHSALCILTQDRLIVVEKVLMLPEHVRIFDLQAVAELTIDYEVVVPKDWNAEMVLDEDIGENVDGKLIITSQRERGPRSHLSVSISDCRRFVDSLCLALERPPQHTVMSQAKHHGCRIALLISLVVLSLVLVAALSSTLRVLPMLFVLCPFYILITSVLSYYSFQVFRYFRGVHVLELDFRPL